MKLFTNEIAPATRLYFQVGGSLNVPIGTRVNDAKFYKDQATGIENKAGDYIYFFDADALVAAGAEYELGKSTKALRRPQATTAAWSTSTTTSSASAAFPM